MVNRAAIRPHLKPSEACIRVLRKRMCEPKVPEAENFSIVSDSLVPTFSWYKICLILDLVSAKERVVVFQDLLIVCLVAVGLRTIS